MISFLGVRTDGQTDGRTDRHGFGILTWKHVGTQKISTQSSKLVVSRRSLYASPEACAHKITATAIFKPVSHAWQPRAGLQWRKADQPTEMT